MRLPRRDPDTLTRGERAIADLLIRRDKRMTCKDIASALDSTPASVKVMICNMRKKGVTISGGGRGRALGYRLEGLI